MLINIILTKQHFVKQLGYLSAAWVETWNTTTNNELSIPGKILNPHPHIKYIEVIEADIIEAINEINLQ